MYLVVTLNLLYSLLVLPKGECTFLVKKLILYLDYIFEDIVILSGCLFIPKSLLRRYLLGTNQAKFLSLLCELVM